MRVSVGDVFSTLSSYLGSTYVNQFNKFGLSLQVYVQADSQFRLQPDDLLNLYVRSHDGTWCRSVRSRIQLGGRAVAGHPVQSLPFLDDHRRAGAGVQLGRGDGAMEQIANQTSAAGHRLCMDGMSYQEKLTGNQLYYLFGLSVLLVYLCLAGQYESWILPLAVYPPCRWRCSDRSWR